MQKEAKMIQLKLKKKKLEIDLKDIEEEIRELTQSLKEEWEASSISKTTIGGYTVYISRRIWAGGDTQELITALKAAGEGDLVKEQVNRNTLTARVKEMAEVTPTMTVEDIHSALPESLKPVIEITEQITFGVKKA